VCDLKILGPIGWLYGAITNGRYLGRCSKRARDEIDIDRTFAQ
jgi:hypothetical protein